MSTLQTTNLKNPSSGSNNIVLDSSGRVLVGTASGKIDFQVKTSGGFQVYNANEIALRYNCYYDGSDRYLQAVGKASSIVLDDSGNFRFLNTNTASTSADSTITSFTERLRISSDGSCSSVIPGGSTLYPQFGCRAWVNFNGTGTVAIRASGNVSSITDNGVGDYTVNFTTALADANYCYNMTKRRDGSTLGIALGHSGTVPTASAFRLLSYDQTTIADSDTINVAIFR